MGFGRAKQQLWGVCSWRQLAGEMQTERRRESQHRRQIAALLRPTFYPPSLLRYSLCLSLSISLALSPHKWPNNTESLRALGARSNGSAAARGKMFALSVAVVAEGENGFLRLE